MSNAIVHSDIERFQTKYRVMPSGCWEWQGALNAKGYGWFRLFGRSDKAHRAAWIIFHGPIPDGLHVLHSCDTPSCVNPNHLFLGTNLDNIKDRDAKGRVRHGVRHPKAIVNEELVRRIRLLERSGLSRSKIAQMHGLNIWTVTDICTGKTWRHVTDTSSGAA